MGTAYSLFTREELPYALDLHLFLGRRLAPAPRRSIADAASSEKTDVPADTSLFGTFPLVRFRSTWPTPPRRPHAGCSAA